MLTERQKKIMKHDDTIFLAGQNYLEDGVALLFSWYLDYCTEQQLPDVYDGFSRLMKRFVDCSIIDLMTMDEVKEKIKRNVEKYDVTRDRKADGSPRQSAGRNQGGKGR